MKKHLLRLSIIAALAASASFAETYYTNVPFDFVVRDKIMPAGLYRTDHVDGTARGVMTMSSAGGQIAFMVMSSPVTSASALREGKLVFHHYADRYFLAEIWGPGRNGGLLLPVTPRERE